MGAQWDNLGFSGNIDDVGHLCGREKLRSGCPDGYRLCWRDLRKTSLLPFLRVRKRPAHVLQQGNVAVHEPRTTKGWLQRLHIQVIDSPACSPDCNLVENMWEIVVRHVYSNNKQSSTVVEPKAAIPNAWGSIYNNVIQNLFNSFI
ncbi:hypothetical protein NECAME_11659 [Necator americanus]|uniref:Tc1-like transposase DDE domain-containing protein n=1 Tax=Necator americanus TaxID=51031 RepID=W2T4F9_NECAM|nr:hypothetical protein NECAME_11659 [Necator americanus]ETN76459.1 hypothetical protein NECAME_11659 [Necator americanus]